MDENPYNLPPMRQAKQRQLTFLLSDAGDFIRENPFIGDYRAYDSELDVQRSIEMILQIDLTPAGKFIPYLCTLVKQSSPAERHRLFYEDTDKISLYLAAVDALHSAYIPFDLYAPLGSYTGQLIALKPAEIFKGLQPYKQRIHNSPRFNSYCEEADFPTAFRNMFKPKVVDTSFIAGNPEEIALLAGKDPAAVIIGKNEDYRLLRINRIAAARFYGRQTQWCTADTDSRSAFDDYNKTGSLFVLLLPRTQEKFQMHFGDEGFVIADSNDDTSIEISSLKDRLNFDEFYPKLIDAAIDDCETRSIMPLLPVEGPRQDGQLAVPPLTQAQNERLYAYAKTLLTHPDPSRRLDGLMMLGNRFFDHMHADKYAQALDAVVQLSFHPETKVRMVVPDYALSGMQALHKQADQIRVTDMIETLDLLSRDPSEGVRNEVATRVKSFDSFHPKFDKALAVIVYRLSHDDHEGIAEGVRNKIQRMSATFQKKVADCRVIERWQPSPCPSYPQSLSSSRQAGTQPS